MRVHLLTEGFLSPNAQAFLFPLYQHSRLIRDQGIDLRVFTSLDDRLADCDVLLIEGKFFRSWWKQPETVISRLDAWRDRTPVVYCDTTDSAGWILGQALPHVDLLVKNQALRDRREYLRPLHGRRTFTDYYHRTTGVSDDSPEEAPQVADAADLDKIRVGWNSGLADYSVQARYRGAVFRRLGWPLLLRRDRPWVPAAAPRPIDVALRMAVNYGRNTVSYQRQQVRDRLGHYLRTDRLPRGKYLDELTRTKVVPSPFGWGEINYKDWEVFTAGALLLKPDMSHLETWPDVYHSGETLVTHRWDLSDLEAVVEDMLAAPERRLAIAQAGQDRYRHFVTGPEAGPLFAQRFSGLLREAVAARP